MKLALYWSMVVLFSLASSVLMAAEADLTRHLATHQRTAGPPDSFSDSFFGTAGPATLILQSENSPKGKVILNGKRVVGPNDLKNVGWVEVAVDLVADNSINVVMNGKPGTSLTVRVKQHANVDYQTTAYTTYSGPTRNYDRSEAFYAMLGWTTGLRFPDTNTPEVAAALGIDHPYDIHVELRILTHGQQLSFIDLIEFFDPVRDPWDDTPYTYLYHLGMTHVAYVTTDIDADYASLLEKGVVFLSAPVGTPGDRFGRFATMKDPDGTAIQLVELPVPGPGPSPCDPNNLPPSTFPGPNPDDPPVFYPCPETHLVRPLFVNVNVSDFEGAREFFRMLGFTESSPLPSISTQAEAEAMGLDEPFEIIGADLTVPDSIVPGGGVAIRLMQWINPTDDKPPYPLPINHPGIQRLVYGSFNSDPLNLMDDKKAALEAQGVQFVSDPAPCCDGPASTGGIMLFFGPDGMIFETGGGVIPEE
jgi:hypothetical protein